MININDLIQNGYGDFHVNITLNDLKAFAMEIIASFQQLGNPDIKEEEELMTKQQVMDYLNVKSTTLWNWSNKKILVPHKISKKIYYSKSDILALQRATFSE